MPQNLLSKLPELVLEALISKISRLVDVEKGDIDTARPLHTSSIDLLSAIEIRSWLRRDLDADVASFEILGDSSIAEPVGIVVTKSGYIMCIPENLGLEDSPIIQKHA